MDKVAHYGIQIQDFLDTSGHLTAAGWSESADAILLYHIK